MQGAKKIPFAPNYSVSRSGKVYKGNKEVKPRTANGYKVVYLSRLGKNQRNSYLVHRLVAFVWNNRADEIENRSLQVHHRNNNKSDNRLSNLVICTRKQHNVFHRIQREYMEYAVKTKKYKEFEKIRLQNYAADGIIE